MDADVAQAFLGDSKETGRRTQWEGTCQARSRKPDANASSLDEIIQVSLECCNEPQILHRRLVKTVGELAQIVRQFADVPTNGANPFARLSRRVRELLGE